MTTSNRCNGVTNAGNRCPQPARYKVMVNGDLVAETCRRHLTQLVQQWLANHDAVLVGRSS